MSRTIRKRIGWHLDGLPGWRKHADFNCQDECCSQKARRRRGEPMRHSDARRAMLGQGAQALTREEALQLLDSLAEAVVDRHR